MDQTEAPLAALARFAIHLVARIEAMERILIQKGVATKLEIETAIAEEEARRSTLARPLGHPDDPNFESYVVGILKRLQIRSRS